MMYETYKKPINDKGMHPPTHSLTMAFDQWQIQREEREGVEICYTSYVLSTFSPNKYCN